MIVEFMNDLEGYNAWTERTPDGYILNIRSGNQPAMLHRTTCGHVFPAKAEYGDFTKKQKICAEERGPLETWAKEHGKAFVLCSNCDV